MNFIEFETKILDIDPEEISKKLLDLGATQEDEYLQRRIVFDIKSENIEWVRVRQEKDKCTMTYKYRELNNKEVGKTIEIETEVSDFDSTILLLSKLGFYYRTMYQENYIKKFSLNGLEFSIARWPKIKPYLEIEGESKVDVDRGLDLLNMKGKEVGDYDIAKIYSDCGIEMNSYERLEFDK